MKLKRRITPDECRRILLRAIRSGDYLHNKRLRVESIATRFRATPATVRKVFNELTVLGILERRSRSGTYLRHIPTKEFLDSSIVRAWLEALAARLACRLLTGSQFQELEILAEQLDQEMLEKPPQSVNYIDLEIAFHEKIVEASGNITLIELAHRDHFIERYIEQHAMLGLAMPAQITERISHRQLVDQLRTRDPLVAQQTMYQHVMLSTLGSIDQKLPAG